MRRYAECEWNGFKGQANTAWGPRQVRDDRSNFEIVRLPVGPAQSVFSNIIIIIATFILRTYPSREDVQGAYRSGYIKIGIHNYAFDFKQYKMHKTLTKRLVH